MEKRSSIRNESFDRVDSEGSLECGCLSIIVLGASGDLAKKKTFPALYNLYHQVTYQMEYSLHINVVSSIMCLIECIPE